MFGPVMTLKEWIQRKAAGADVPDLDSKTITLQLLKVSAPVQCFTLCGL